MPDITQPEGFPDLFVYKVRDVVLEGLAADPDYGGLSVFTRALRPSDPAISVGIVEGPADPNAYEIMGQVGPSVIRWTVAIQVMVKHSDEIEGRNSRMRLLRRIRKTIFLPSTVSALSTLSDDLERVTRFQVTNFDYDAAQGRNQNQQFFLLGQVQLTFDTELR